MKPLIVANWKTYNDKDAVERFMNQFQTPDHVQVVIAPSVLDIDTVIAHEGVACALQDVNPAGAVITGGVDAHTAAHRGVRYAIVGHSERRKWYHEDNAIIEKKLQACADAHLIPILCVGETQQGSMSEAWEAIASQVGVLTPGLADTAIIAYEPVWAVGSDKVPTIEHVAGIAKRIAEYVQGVGAQAAVLYGGSVDEQSVAYIAGSGVQGVLVGRASTDPDRLMALCQAWSI